MVKKLVDRFLDDIKGTYDLKGDPDIMRKLKNVKIYVSKDMFAKVMNSRGVQLYMHVDRPYFIVQTARGRIGVDIIMESESKEDYYIMGEIPKV